MGKSASSRKDFTKVKGKFGKGGKNDKSGKQEWVPKFSFYAKAHLAAYPDENGVPLYLGDADNEKKFFKKGFCLKTRTAKNCELFTRVGMALNLGASTFDVGAQTLEKRLGMLPALEEGEVKSNFDKTGLVPLVELLKLDEGEKFKLAAQVLNAGKDKTPTKEEIEEAVRDLFGFLETQQDNLRKVLPKVATFCAKGYLFAMTLHELLDFHGNQAVWANRMESDKKTGTAMKAWLEKPNEEELFLAAMTEAFVAKVKKNKKEKKKSKKKKASDSSGSGSSGSESSKSSSGDKEEKKSDSSDSSDKKAKAKPKKEKKKSESSDSSDKKAKVKAKKEKKDKKAKKAKSDEE